MLRPSVPRIDRRPRRAISAPVLARARSIGRRLLIAVVVFVVLVLALMSIGAGVGRFHAVPVDGQGPDVRVPHSSLAIVVPVAPLRLRSGDVIMTRIGSAPHEELYRITGVDSWTHQTYALNHDGRLVEIKLGSQVGRVSSFIPYVGTPFRFAAGSPQGLALLFLAMLLLAKAAVQRKTRYPSLTPLRVRIATRIHDVVSPVRAAPRRAQERERLGQLLRTRGLGVSDEELVGARLFAGGPWWWTRLGASVLWALGLLSLTASATFTATATVNQGAITTGHMAISVPAAGATNRLTLGATTIAPGDRIQRALDVSVDGTTTSGIMTGMTLAVSASPSSALNTDSTNGLRIFVQDCRTSGGASGWTESGSTPAFSYSCTKGGGGTWSDLLNSAPTNDPTAVSAAGTCATSSGGTSSYRAVSELSSAYTFLNLPTLSASTTLHLVITMCFPTAAGDSFQDVTSTLTFSFAGVQRAGTAK